MSTSASNSERPADSRRHRLLRRALRRLRSVRRDLPRGHGPGGARGRSISMGRAARRRALRGPTCDALCNREHAPHHAPAGAGLVADDPPRPQGGRDHAEEVRKKRERVRLTAPGRLSHIKGFPELPEGLQQAGRGQLRAQRPHRAARPRHGGRCRRAGGCRQPGGSASGAAGGGFLAAPPAGGWRLRPLPGGLSPHKKASRPCAAGHLMVIAAMQRSRNGCIGATGRTRNCRADRSEASCQSPASRP